jgi:uncharacterized protein (TIGR03437 family)
LLSILALLASAALSAATLVPIYGTYFGGTGDTNTAVAVTLDASGNVIVAGITSSQTLPGTANAFQPTKAPGFPDSQNVYIAKFNQTGHVLLWATFLGGDQDDRPTSVAVDPSGNVYVVGVTSSSTFPVTPGAYQGAAVTNASTGFASKISADGSTLLYSTYLPGGPSALAVSSVGEAYIAGAFPFAVITTGAIGAGETPVGTGGVFLLRLNSTGTSLIFGAYLGGDGFNGSITTSVAIDQQGNIYVAGYTSDNGPSNVTTTPNAFEPQLPAGIISNPNQVFAGFIVEVNSAGSQLVYGTFFGPPYSSTQIAGLAVAPDGSLFFSGSINTASMWATPGAYLATPSPGFVAKLIPGKTTLDSFSFVDGSATLLSAELANQPQQFYIGFNSGGNASEVAELSAPSLSLASSYSLPQGSSAGFAAAALAPLSSLWVAGFCNPCALGNLVSSDAFQPSPQGSSATFLIQLTNISPTISFTASAATGTSPFAAGQLVSIYGSQLGPAAGSGLQLGPGGTVTNSNSGTQVLFDGTAAPILYTGAGQVNAAIPCEVAGQSSTQMIVEYMGAQSAPVTVALSPAAPGIFTANGSGQGQAAALNQDNSFNSPSNPAAPGTIVTFYATGVGPTSPCVDGATYQSNFPMLTLPVIVGVGSSGAQVVYSGQAPDLVSGVAQFNVVIPSDAPSGVLSLTLIVGGVYSAPGVTIAVK